MGEGDAGEELLGEELAGGELFGEELMIEVAGVAGNKRNLRKASKANYC